MKKKRKRESPVNLLNLVPVQNTEWEKEKEGLVVLLKPKFQNTFLKKHLLSLMKKPYYRIKLDEVGSHVWNHCDGKHTVKDVADSLYQKFGEKVEPLYDRLALFFQSLEKNRFIFYENK